MLHRTAAATQAALLAFAAVLLFARADLSIPLGNFLWGEDGSVFLNQAHALGIAGVFTPHAGYFLAYPRLIAWLADAFPLALRPALYAAGWIGAYSVMVLLLALGAQRLGVGTPGRFALVGLAVLQPHNGESIMNLTNAQWMLGAGFAALILTQRAPFPLRPLIGAPALALLGLTGPYSLILAPALLLRWWRQRWSLRAGWWAALVLACGVLQAIAAASTGHFRTIPPNAAQQPFPWNWLFPITQITAFGAESALTRGAAIALWCAALVALARAGRPAQALRVDVLILLVAAASFVAASLVAFRANPAFIAPYGVGNRYTWAPYTLLFLAAVAATQRMRPERLVVLGAAGLICAAFFQRKSPAEMHFASFARFSLVRPVVIPVAPPRERFPNWHVAAAPPAADALQVAPIEVSAADFQPVQAAASTSRTFTWDGNDPQLVLNTPLVCPSAGDVGVEIDMQRSSPGWLQLFWDAQSDFREVQSFRRWYPAGDVVAQFAFRTPSAALRLRFDPAEAAGSAELRTVRIYCLTTADPDR